MTRTYNVIDADGHILEPFTLWGEYLDPKFRERAPKLIKDENGIQKLLLEDKQADAVELPPYGVAVALNNR